MSAIAELEDRCLELENELSYRESDLFDAHRQIEELRAQLAVAQAGEWQPVAEADYHHPDGLTMLHIAGEYLAISCRDGNGTWRRNTIRLPSTWALCQPAAAHVVQAQPDYAAVRAAMSALPEGAAERLTRADRHRPSGRARHRWRTINGTERNVPGRQTRQCVRCGCVLTWHGFFIYRDGNRTVQSVRRPPCIANEEATPKPPP